jgi:hypothetical protein
MNKEINTTGDTRFLTWKTLPMRKRKNHGRQPANLHYDGVRLQTPGIYNFFLSQNGGLQEVYKGAKP